MNRTMKNTEAVAQCPLCGHEADIRDFVDRRQQHWREVIHIRCPRCHEKLRIRHLRLYVALLLCLLVGLILVIVLWPAHVWQFALVLGILAAALLGLEKLGVWRMKPYLEKESSIGGTR